MHPVTPTTDRRKPQWLGVSRDLWFGAILTFGSLLVGFGVIFRAGVPIANALMWALAFVGSSSVVGFIFGIPRAHSPEIQNSTQGYALRVNTNLEQISDWFTKLLVGAGLAEIRSMPSDIARLAHFIADGWGTSASGYGQSLAAALIIYFVAEGFFGGYLVTRMFFQSAFLRADEELL